MAGTKIVEVRSALMAAIAALPEFADARVDMTWSPTVQVRDQAFTITATFNQAPAGMRAGRVFRKEFGSFEVVVMVSCVDEGMTFTSSRAGELGTVIEEWIADHKNGEALDVDGLNWIVVEGDGALRELYDDRSTRALLSYSVNYEARLT
jgi:hypothetical protein